MACDCLRFCSFKFKTSWILICHRGFCLWVHLANSHFSEYQACKRHGIYLAWDSVFLFALLMSVLTPTRAWNAIGSHHRNIIPRLDILTRNNFNTNALSHDCCTPLWHKPVTWIGFHFQKLVHSLQALASISNVSAKLSPTVYTVHKHSFSMNRATFYFCFYLLK